MTSDDSTRIPSRAPDLIARDMDGEIVVMDQEAKLVHLLKDVAADVWRAAEAGESLPASSQVDVAVARMTDAGLLQGAEGVSRRNLLRSATLLAGVGLTSMALPPAIAMASSNVATTLTLVVASTMVRNTAQTASGTLTRTGGGAAVPGQTVTLYADKLNGSGGVQSTVTLGTALTQSDGSYSISFTAPAQGSYAFYTVSTASAPYTQATSNRVPVTVTN